MRMVYVGRDAEGRICAYQDEPGGRATEPIAGDAPEIRQFLHQRWRQSELERMDLDFVRVIEDLIEILIARKVIMFTDLPPEVQTKLTRRRQIRQHTDYKDALGHDDLIQL